MTITVRTFGAEDAPAVAAILAATAPYFVVSPHEVLWEHERRPAAARGRFLIAEEAGQVAGFATAGLNATTSVPGEAELIVTVAPRHRGRGVGTALHRAGKAHVAEVGARAVRTWMAEDGSCEWAERRGFRRTRRSLHLQLDLSTAPKPAPIPPGVELRPLRDYAEDPRTVYFLDEATSRDEPADVAYDSVAFEDWYRMWWDRPGQDPDLSLVAVVDGVPAALTFARTDGGARYRSGLTGVLPRYRGRGLATLLKATALRAAHARGLRVAFTGNDEDNAPMRAVNAKLGYRCVATEVAMVADLGTGEG